MYAPADGRPGRTGAWPPDAADGSFPGPATARGPAAKIPCSMFSVAPHRVQCGCAVCSVAVQSGCAAAQCAVCSVAVRCAVLVCSVQCAVATQCAVWLPPAGTAKPARVQESESLGIPWARCEPAPVLEGRGSRREASESPDPGLPVVWITTGKTGRERLGSSGM